MSRFIIAVGALLIFSLIAGGWAVTLSQMEPSVFLNNPDSLLRFHVVAHSDSQFDQDVKNKVRDATLAYLTPRLATAGSVSEAREIIAANRAEIDKIAREVLAANHASYDVATEIGHSDFPVKAYGAVTVPAGRYEAVRILLGNAGGRNWWCVLFPPLCFIDVNTTIAQPVAASSAKPTGAVPGARVEWKWKLAELLPKSDEPK